MGPLLRWKRVCSCGSWPPAIWRGTCTRRDPRTLTRPSSTCRPTNPPGWLISCRGHLFFLVALCNSLLSLLAPLLQFHPTSSGDSRLHRHRHRHRSHSFQPSQPPNLLRPPPGYLPHLTPYFVPVAHPSPCTTPTIQSVASSSSERASIQTRATRSVCPEPSHRLRLPDSSASGRVAQSKSVSQRHSPRFVPSRSNPTYRRLAWPSLLWAKMPASNRN
ncbi:hypothetical protein B0T18DRAFT_110987 [Schizothecium vesticola]|uniref:Uncharacterized protein n=1 Tax=Schizothecium vesticola TaxID=314040 RepID=A0AA40F207_9PEZI|nr:hypothetical protein B0T18DRAFT_110987 [Schizothecium vesticola]